MTRPNLEGVFADWKEREALAEAMIPMIGELYRKNVLIYIHGVPLYNNKSVVDLMKIHRFVRQIEHNEMSEFETYPILKQLCQLNLSPAHIDIGKLTSQIMKDNEGLEIADYVTRKCASIIGVPTVIHQPIDVVVYGFGRIGRLVTRLLVEKTGGGHNLVQKAVVLRPPKDPILDLHRRASLLRRDSIHGGFRGTIRIDEENQVLVCNGNVIRFIYANDPSVIDYTQYGIKQALVIDSSGAWRDEAGLAQHFKAKGIVKVLLTTFGKGAIKNIVSGINSDLIGPEDKLIAAASCTTNAIVPVLKCINDRFGIVQGHMETVHAYTDDQNLHDNIHAKTRRGRSAPLNMVLTESNATQSVGKLLPELAGKLTGNSIRVPVPNVSMAILHLTLSAQISREEVNEYLRNISLNSSMQRQIGYTISREVVSSDFIGDRHAGVIDSEATIAEGKQVVLYVWYDNEFGYTCQVIRVAQKMVGIKYPEIPCPLVTDPVVTAEQPKLKMAGS